MKPGDFVYWVTHEPVSYSLLDPEYSLKIPHFTWDEKGLPFVNDCIYPKINVGAFIVGGPITALKRGVERQCFIVELLGERHTVDSRYLRDEPFDGYIRDLLEQPTECA